MNPLTFITTTGEPNPQDFAALSTGLRAHHASEGHSRVSEKYSIFIRDEAGATKAGIIVTFLWNGMHIDSLWVDESMRGQQLGKKLMEMAETEAKKRGCTISYTDTFTWQAPGFYEKLGYTLYGTLEGFPQDNALHYYRKNLT